MEIRMWNTCWKESPAELGVPIVSLWSNHIIYLGALLDVAPPPDEVVLQQFWPLPHPAWTKPSVINSKCVIFHSKPLKHVCERIVNNYPMKQLGEFWQNSIFCLLSITSVSVLLSKFDWKNGPGGGGRTAKPGSMDIGILQPLPAPTIPVLSSRKNVKRYVIMMTMTMMVGMMVMMMVMMTAMIIMRRRRRRTRIMVMIFFKNADISDWWPQFGQIDPGLGSRFLFQGPLKRFTFLAKRSLVTSLGWAAFHGGPSFQRRYSVFIYIYIHI